MRRLAFGAEKDTIRNMKTPSRLPCCALLAAASLALCFQAPLRAEEKPALAAQEKKLTSEKEKQAEEATSAHNEAGKLYREGYLDKAEKVCRTALVIRERVLGAEHPDTLSSRNNLAIVLFSRAKYGEAEKEHRAVLAIFERVLGAEHPDTLGSRNNLAKALFAQGKFADAEAEYRAVLAIFERVLGAEHLDTLKSRNNLAATLQAQFKNAEAVQEHRKVLPIMERVLGVEHHDTLESRNNLGYALQAQGRNAEAEIASRGARHPRARARRGASRCLPELLQSRPLSQSPEEAPGGARLHAAGGGGQDEGVWAGAPDFQAREAASRAHRVRDAQAVSGAGGRAPRHQRADSRLSASAACAVTITA